MANKRRHSSSSNKTESQDFEIQSIDGCIWENGLSNKTDLYDSVYYEKALIIRRGQPFHLRLNLAPESKVDLTSVFLHLKTSSKPSKRSGTWIQVGLKGDVEEDDDWYYTLVEEAKASVKIAVNVPSNALVSKYAMTVQVTGTSEGKKKLIETSYDKDVYILFNPWCENDDVYMESDELKSEYVLNDTGCVYWSGLRAKPWFFGQFTDAALHCTFLLLEKSHARRRDTAREVARDISAKANSFDNNGLLTGNWSGDYSGGVKPWQWTGSVKIFKKYLETKESVEYGQCWVFSGLVTSMMRTLGIPCRSVTNYSSAHDTDNNCTFDKYYDEDMNYLEDESDDSCWNFHVWNDVWMARPDLPQGMGGWQAVDGTPQEESRGIYRCGPASLQAIREGNVHYNYDTKFVFAEVNAETVFWQRQKDEEGREKWVPVRTKGDSVGRDISTKSVNSSRRSDVTGDYKHKEGSLLERAAVRNALKRTRSPAIKAQANTVKFSSKLPYESDCDSGVDFTISARNQASEVYTINVAVTAQLIRYTGVTLQEIKKKTDSYTLKADEAHDFNFHYEPNDYIEQLDENVAIRLSFMAKVEETKQIYVSQKISNIKKPDLELELVDASQMKVKPGELVKVKVTFPKVCNFRKYTGGSLNFDGPLLEDETTVTIGDVDLAGEASVVQAFQVKKTLQKKNHELVVEFDSEELSGLTGTLEFTADV